MMIDDDPSQEGVLFDLLQVLTYISATYDDAAAKPAWRLGRPGTQQCPVPVTRTARGDSIRARARARA